MSDPYFWYVVAAYLSTAAILGWLLWSTLRANARARADLQALEKERGR